MAGAVLLQLSHGYRGDLARRPALRGKRVQLRVAAASSPEGSYATHVRYSARQSVDRMPGVVSVEPPPNMIGASGAMG